MIPVDLEPSEAALVHAAGRSRSGVPFSIGQAALLGVAGWLAWRPVETFPWSAVLTATVFLAFVVWGWQRTSLADGRTLWSLLGAAIVLLVLGLNGRDPSAAIVETALLVALGALIWLASREAPPNSWPAVLGLIFSGLAVWGILQVMAGPEEIDAILLQLPEALRPAALERLGAGRAFASQPLPSHLAVLFATALPLLLVRCRWRWSAGPWALGVGLCVVGLAATRSPVGVGLALMACAALAVALGGRPLRFSVLVLAVVLAAVVLARGDVLELEPVALRLDNWRTSLWIWSTAPAAGVGFGGFGQMAQTVPFAVGNRPRYAHSLPLEWLAELGPVGLLAFFAAGFALWRLVMDLWPRRPDLAVAILVIPSHNLVDFSLHDSGVALPWAVLVGWAIAVRGPSQNAGEGPRGRPLAVTLAALGLAAAILHATSVTVLDSAALAVPAEKQFAGARTARHLAPWRSDPLGLMAVAALKTGDVDVIAEAADELERARWLRPFSASLADLRGHLAQALGRAPSTVAEAWTAQHDHPQNSAYQRRMTRVILRLQGEDGDQAD